MRIRLATNLDRDDIRDVNLAAFAEDERDIVAKLAVDLLAEETTPPTMALVAEADDAMVGHVAFSPVTTDDNEQYQGYILAPLAVKPGYQKRRIGSKLVESGTEQLSGMGVDILFVYGDPDYYGRVGFNADAAARYIPPYRLDYPFGWQGIILTQQDTGTTPVNISCVASLCDPKLW